MGLLWGTNWVVISQNTTLFIVAVTTSNPLYVTYNLLNVVSSSPCLRCVNREFRLWWNFQCLLLRQQKPHSSSPAAVQSRVKQRKGNPRREQSSRSDNPSINVWSRVLMQLDVTRAELPCTKFPTEHAPLWCGNWQISLYSSKINDDLTENSLGTHILLTSPFRVVSSKPTHLHNLSESFYNSRNDVYNHLFEERRLLGYKTKVRTSQKTHYVSATELSQLMLWKIWGFQSGAYEELFSEV
jgi:hypothetical protein